MAGGAASADLPDMDGLPSPRPSYLHACAPIGAVFIFALLHLPAPVVATAHAESVRDTVTVLPPVDVEAERRRIEGRETAATVRLDRAGLSRFVPGHTTDALLAVPGVDLVRTGPWASRISLRGMSSERVLLLVDGVRVNSVRGHGAQAALISPERLEAVELMPGATSAQFGSDAMGGVINLVTHRNLLGPEPRLGLSVMARGAEPGRSWKQTGRLRWISPRLGLEATGGIGGTDALVTREGRIENSGDRTDDYALRGMARLGRVTADYEHARESAHDVGLPAFNNAAGATGLYPLQRRTLNRLELSMPGGGWVPEARLLAAHQRFFTQFDETTVDSSFVRGRFVATRTTRQLDLVENPGWTLRPEATFRGWGTLRLSGEFRREETAGPRSETVTVRNAAGEVTSTAHASSESVPPAFRNVWAGSVSGSKRVAGFLFETGARYDRQRSRADSTENSPTSTLDVTDRRFSAEGGVSRRLGALEPFAHVASGFRAPTLQERYYNDGLRLFGNPDLRAERSVSYEAGLRFADLWNGRVRSARVSAYRSEVDDLITFQYIGQLYLIPRFQYVNVDRARLEGVELAGRLRLGAFDVDLNAAAPRGVDRRTGGKLLDAGAARVTVDVATSIHPLLPLGRAAFRWRWNDAVSGVDSDFLRPAFQTGALELSTVVNETRAVFAVRNLWNADYREPLSFIDEPARTYTIALRRDFDFAPASR
jgi:outer membrane receptor protein involved in Fe transport